MLNGDAETGVSIMYMAEELDAGDVIRVAKTPIDPEEDLPSLWNRLAGAGGGCPVCGDSHAGGRHCRPDASGRQSGDLCAYAVTGNCLPIDWTRPMAVIRNQVRGLIPVALRCGGAGRAAV